MSDQDATDDQLSKRVRHGACSARASVHGSADENTTLARTSVALAALAAGSRGEVASRNTRAEASIDPAFRWMSAAYAVLA